ncbi:MAG: 2-oxoacid:ferredoxin oxidoreductase subunit beta [Acidobacteria bacterium]|nr:2-oxoacid:ferredoxin oxidoreductase subunit beta [Acidobacteriota bacterium]
MAAVKHINFEQYLRQDYRGLQWCPGCGDGAILQAFLRAVHELGISQDDMAVVSGIGCSGRISGYIDFNTMHTTHGRAISFATGIKLARPDKHVVVFGGDGDQTAIGGNHFIHACRRNIDLTICVINNNVYGMTGGQYSPTTPREMKTQTTPYGNYDNQFDVVNLAIGAGATYVARESVWKPVALARFFKKGLRHKGVSVIEVVSNCHINLGRRNKMKSPHAVLDWIKGRTVSLAKAKNMNEEELIGKVLVGEFVEKDKPEFTEQYYNLVKSLKK